MNNQNKKEAVARTMAEERIREIVREELDVIKRELAQEFLTNLGSQIKKSSAFHDTQSKL